MAPTEQQWRTDPDSSSLKELSPDQPLIRNLTTEDIPRIWEIMVANIKPEYDRAFPESSDRHTLMMTKVNTYIHNMEETLAHNGSTYFVAEVDGVVAGCLGCVHDSERMKTALIKEKRIEQSDPYKVVELINFYVDPELHRHGIGRRLWNQMTTIVNEKIQPDLIAFASRDIWKSAHQFYKDMEYTPFHNGRYYNFDTTFFVKAVE